MIDEYHIRTKAAREKIDAGIIEKDYILSKTLMALAASGIFQKNFVFKGGTALKKCYYANWRFSEDLDFSSRKQLNREEVQSLFQEAVDNVRRIFGLSMRITEYSQYPREGDEPVTAQLKLGYDGPLRKTSGQKNNIRLDISYDENIYSDKNYLPVFKSYEDDIEAQLPVYTLEEIMAEKLRSILQRGKSRDYYDVWILLKDHDSDFDAKLVIEIMKKKCHDKGIGTPKPEDFFMPQRIEDAARYWQRGLAHQVEMLPNFIQITGELKNLLNELIG